MKEEKLKSSSVYKRGRVIATVAIILSSLIFLGGLAGGIYSSVEINKTLNNYVTTNEYISQKNKDIFELKNSYDEGKITKDYYHSKREKMTTTNINYVAENLQKSDSEMKGKYKTSETIFVGSLGTIAAGMGLTMGAIMLACKKDDKYEEALIVEGASQEQN